MNCFFRVLGVLFGLSLFVACSKNASSGMGTTFESRVKATAPEFSSSSGSIFRVANALSSRAFRDSGGSYLSNLLRTYTYPSDEGVLDMSNMYKALYELKLKLDNAESTCTTAFSSKTITSPFTGFPSSYEYTCGGKTGTMSDTYTGGIATRSEGTVTNILYGFQWSGNTGGGSIGTAQATFDSSTNNLVYDMVNCVNCGGGSDNSFTNRLSISGSIATKVFTIRTLTRTPSSTTAVVGKGTSEGSGVYMLFKYKVGSGTPAYYCIDPTATHTAVASGAGMALGAVASSNCSTLQTDVEALTLFTSSDAPFALSDFTNSTILLSF